MMEIHRMEFTGSLLRRGFWVYIWRIQEGTRQVLYVGRTGDSSSCFASSPFRRIGQHLDLRIGAKANAMTKQLWNAGIDPAACTFKMTAIGPLFPEQRDFESHRGYRDITGALEWSIADWLRGRGYEVLGTHGRRQLVQPEGFIRLVGALELEYRQIS